MKLVGSVTFTVTKDDPTSDRQVATTKDFGEVSAEETRIALFQFASQLANDIPHGAAPRALSVTVEA